MADRVNTLKRQASQRHVNQADESPVLRALEDVVADAPEEAGPILQQARDACSSFPFPRPRRTIRAWSPGGSADWQFIAGDERDGKLVSDIDEYLGPLHIIRRLSLARSPVPLSPRDQQQVTRFNNECQPIPYGLLSKISSPITSATCASKLQEFYFGLDESALKEGIAEFFGRDITLKDIEGRNEDVIERLIGLRSKQLAAEAPGLQDSDAEPYRAQTTDIISLLVLKALLQFQTPDWSSWDKVVNKLTERFGVADHLQPFWAQVSRLDTST